MVNAKDIYNYAMKCDSWDEIRSAVKMIEQEYNDVFLEEPKYTITDIIRHLNQLEQVKQ